MPQVTQPALEGLLVRSTLQFNENFSHHHMPQKIFLIGYSCIENVYAEKISDHIFDHQTVS